MSMMNPLPNPSCADRTVLSTRCRLPVEEFENRFGPILNEAEREADIETIGGLVFRLAGHVAHSR